MTTEIITAIIAALGGGGAILALIKGGLIKIQIGKVNGNGTKTELDELHQHAEIANTEMGEMNRKFDKLIEMTQEILFIIRREEKK